MSWLFSQALVAEYSRATCSAGDASAQLSVMPTAQPFWLNVKPMDASRRSQFGLTLRRLTDAHGAALLTWFLAGFPARTSAQPDQVPALTESEADCGASSRGSFAKWIPSLCLWRTAQCSLLGDSDEFSETWPRWGLMRNGACSELPTSVRPILENACGLWQTPVADDAVDRQRGKWNSRGEPKLSAQVMLVPTPTVHGNYNRKGASKSSGDGLATFVRRFPTPTVSMRKGSSGGALTRKNGKSRANDRLDYAIEGDASLGRLNPEWVEWLMGWPIGWTELRPLETDKFQEWQQQHGDD